MIDSHQLIPLPHYRIFKAQDSTSTAGKGQLIQASAGAEGSVLWFTFLGLRM